MRTQDTNTGINQGTTMKLRFFRLNRRWYADVPEHTLEENEMVSGADTLMETISHFLLKGSDDVCMEFATQAHNPLLQLDRISHDDFGADYMVGGSLARRHNVRNFKVWICNVTHDVFGEHPERIYVTKLASSMEELDKYTVHNLVILDESGSMSSIYHQALSGANETIQTIRSAQKNDENQRHRLTFVTFDTSNREYVRRIIDNKPIAEVKDLTERDYIPNGCTPLYDAIGISLTRIKNEVKEGDQVLVTIITDGYENASREYNGAMIKKMIEGFRAQGWTFTYIGANQDAVEVSKTIGIRNAMNFRADEEGTRKMWEYENMQRCAYYEKLKLSKEQGILFKEDTDFFKE